MPYQKSDAEVSLYHIKPDRAESMGDFSPKNTVNEFFSGSAHK